MIGQSWQQAEFTVSALYRRRVCEVLRCLEVSPFQKMSLSIWDEKAVKMKCGLRDSPPKTAHIPYNAPLSGSITTKLWKRTIF